MRIFNYRSEALRLLDFESINKIGLAYKFMERHSLAKVHIPAMLQEMEKISLIQNITIGLSTDNRAIGKDRVVELILEDSPADTYEEGLALGYYRAFMAIHNGELENDDVFSAAKRLHKLFFSGVPGKHNFWRTSNEPVYRKAKDYHLKHHPIPAKDVQEDFGRVCDQCQKILSEKIIHVLYIIPIFIVDTVYIQPFEKESQVLIRLLTQHILHNAGFPIFEYTCLEHLIREDVGGLYSAIEKSMLHWEQEINDYKPVFDYYMDVVQKSCFAYNGWVSDLTENIIIKQKLIEKYIKAVDGEVTKQMVRDFCVGISDPTIQLALSQLLKAGVIEKLHQGRSTAYRYIGDSPSSFPKKKATKD